MSSVVTETKPVKRKTDTDWTALRLEYINGTMSLRDLAANHDINPAGVMKRASKENWEEARRQKSALVSSAAQDKITEDRIEQLLQFSAKDVELAILAKQKVEDFMQSLTNATEAQTLNTLTTAMSNAQRVGRLALGAETSNSKVTSTNTNIDRKETLNALLVEIDNLTAKLPALPAPK